LIEHDIVDRINLIQDLGEINPDDEKEFRAVLYDLSLSNEKVLQFIEDSKQMKRAV
jgi:hypothetical protein